MADAAQRLFVLNSGSLERVEQRKIIDTRLSEEINSCRKSDSGTRQFEMIAITTALYVEYSAQLLVFEF